VKLAFLFPGQGAQAVGMGRALAEVRPQARTVFEAADRTLGFALSDLMWNGPEDELRKTMNAQPALLTHSVAALRVLEASGVAPAWTAGHSLGEYSACVAAGALSFEDALTLTRRRGELMYAAGLERPGTMAAILGLDGDQVEAVCERAGASGVVRAANYNAPGQVVISGEIPAVERACELAREAGAKRAIKLEVSGAFHSPLMAGAASGLREALERVTIRDARCPVISNVTAQPVQKSGEIRAALEAQLLSAVRWQQSMQTLIGFGAERFLEIGTGSVLRGLLRKLDPSQVASGIDDGQHLADVLAQLGAASAGRAS
jgi:[acyl-carrier-protein] S-malonyltransferase